MTRSYELLKLGADAGHQIHNADSAKSMDDVLSALRQAMREVCNVYNMQRATCDIPHAMYDEAAMREASLGL